MSEKPSVEKVSTEMGTLLGRIRELEHTLSRKLETTLKNTTRKLRGESAMEAAAGASPMAISNERRRRLIELTAYCKAERRGFAGLPLMALVAVWLAGRVAMTPGLGIPRDVASIIDLAVLPTIALTILPAMVRAGNPRNLILIAVLFLDRQLNVKGKEELKV